MIQKGRKMSVCNVRKFNYNSRKLQRDNFDSMVHVIEFGTMILLRRKRKHAKTLEETYHCKFCHLQNTQLYMCKCKIHAYYCTQHSRHSCENL